MFGMRKLERRVSELENQLRELQEQRNHPGTFTTARIEEVTKGIESGKVTTLTAGWPPAILPGGPHIGISNDVDNN